MLFAPVIIQQNFIIRYIKNMVQNNKNIQNIGEGTVNNLFQKQYIAIQEKFKDFQSYQSIQNEFLQFLQLMLSLSGFKNYVIFLGTLMPSFETIKPQIELYLKKLVDKIKDVLQDACKIVQKNEIEPSYNECEGTSQKYCLKTFTNASCLTDGVFISNKSGIRYPSASYYQNMTLQNKIITSTTTKIDDTLREIKNAFTNTIGRVYFGLQTGFFRAYPGEQRDCSTSYDARDRPWYVAGITGSKIIALCIDLSQQLSEQQLKDMKSSLKKLINSLTKNDFISVVVKSFDGQLEILHSNKLQKATDNKKSALNNQINLLQTNKQLLPITLNEIYETISSLFSKVSHQQNACLTSTKILHLINLSFENKTQNQATAVKLYEWSLKQGIIINSFALSQKNNEILKNISEQSNGTFYPISKSRTFTLVLREYQKFLSHFLNIDEPNWTEPYYDLPTGKRTITGYMPIYIYDKRWRRRIVGTAAIDVLMSSLQINGISEQTVLSFVKCSPAVKIQFKNQLLQCLKEPELRLQPKTDCSFYKGAIIQQQCSLPKEFKIIENPKKKFPESANYRCCSLQTETFKTLILSIGISVIVLSIILIFICKVWKKRNMKMIQSETLSSLTSEKETKKSSSKYSSKKQYEVSIGLENSTNKFKQQQEYGQQSEEERNHKNGQNVANMEKLKYQDLSESRKKFEIDHQERQIIP